jgi:hypothetical protein
VWVLAASVLVFWVLQKSLGDALVSALLGLPVFLLLLAGGMFVVKTRLRLQNHPERGLESRLGASELEGFQAEYRRARGIKEVLRDQAPQAARSPAPAAPLAIPPLPTLRAAPPASVPVPPQLATPMPTPTPDQDDEIHRKILEVRLAALRAQRKAQKLAQR